MKINLFQALEVLNENRPNRPRSLTKKKLQQAIDVVNEYASLMPSAVKHRCGECKHCVYFVDIGERPYSSRTSFLCDAIDKNQTISTCMDVSKDDVSCGMFTQKENDKEI